MCIFFLFKQKTAYEMRISDWSSDVCSSDRFKPMKYIGIWWGMIRGDWSWAEGPKHGATTERTKQYIDFAAKHGFGGVLVEGWNKGWNGNWFGHGDEFSFTQATADFDLKAVTELGSASCRARVCQYV